LRIANFQLQIFNFQFAMIGLLRSNALMAYEFNFDGIVGPSHNYAGLSFGNVASQRHGQSVSSPRQAALQGLAKMKFLHDLGVKQAVLPPQPRPDLATLRKLGFTGSDADILQNANRQDPRLLAAVYSSSAMWAANAATVSPGVDANDGNIHITPANLISQFHRSIEPPDTARLLRGIFPEGKGFSHHDPLPAADAFADEGAANHMRLCARHGEAGIEIFVYGRTSMGAATTPARYPARQTLEAANAIARRHQLHGDRTIFVKQNPAAIDIGAFHNDVVAVANENVLLFHADAYENTPAFLDELRSKFRLVAGNDPIIFIADASELSLADAVQTYIFNSQLVTLPDGSMSLIAPLECRDHPRVQAFVQRILGTNSPVKSVHYLDVRQSMKNGGGPACLRLRVVLDDQQQQHLHPGVVLTNTLYDSLVRLVEGNYREQLQPSDLTDPQLYRECRTILGQFDRLLSGA
jgi:succinylarginine dihydrolase